MAVNGIIDLSVRGPEQHVYVSKTRRNTPLTSSSALFSDIPCITETHLPRCISLAYWPLMPDILGCLPLCPSRFGPVEKGGEHCSSLFVRFPYIAYNIDSHVKNVRELASAGIYRIRLRLLSPSISIYVSECKIVLGINDRCVYINDR